MFVREKLVICSKQFCSNESRLFLPRFPLSERLFRFGSESSPVLADCLWGENFQSYTDRPSAPNAVALQNSCFRSSFFHCPERLSAGCGATFVAVFHFAVWNTHPTNKVRKKMTDVMFDSYVLSSSSSFCFCRCCPNWMKDKLMYHMLVLILHIDNYKTELQQLITYFKMSTVR